MQQPHLHILTWLCILHRLVFAIVDHLNLSLEIGWHESELVPLSYGALLYLAKDDYSTVLHLV